MLPLAGANASSILRKRQRWSELWQPLRRGLLLRHWIREEQRLGRASWLNPAVLIGLGLAFSALGATSALQRSRALQAEHDARLQESMGILTATLAGVQRNSQDWAHWTSMYDWVKGTNPGFVKTDVETTPLFDEGGLFLIFNPDGTQKLSFGHKGHDSPAYRPLFACAQQHLRRLTQVLSRLPLLCRGADGNLYLGVATPISDSTETAPMYGAMVMFDPLLKPHYGPAFNRPLEWLVRHLRQIPAPGVSAASAVPIVPARGGAAMVVPQLRPGEQRDSLDLPQPLLTEQGGMITLQRQSDGPQILVGVGRDLLLALAALASVLLVRALLLSERRAQRLQQRQSELQSNRRIRRASRELDQLLERLGPAAMAKSADELVLSRLIDAPAIESQPLATTASMERKLERLADRFQVYLDRAKYLALLDPLTQLPNRRYFIEQVGVMMEESRDHCRRFAVLFVDIDKFKSINDSYGHAIGDAALVYVANQLRALTRVNDFLGRYGGDEFAILMEIDGEGDLTDAALTRTLHAYAQRMASPFERAVDLAGFSVDLSISVGISLMDGSELDLEGAMRRSDIAMYRAKQNVYERIAIFSQADEGSHLDNYQLYSELMQSIRDRDFAILFQPILDAQGQLYSLEALARWRHPRRGLLGPELFLDLAERYRQVGLLSDELMDLSLSTYRQLDDLNAGLRLSINLPPSKLSDVQLIADLCRGLERHGLEPGCITIEITERSVLLHNAVVTANLRQLRELGMAISLDDFGTGYSSLSLLSTLQPDEVKIDKSFVMALHHDDYARQIVTLIVEMAQRMNLLVVAEGVENERSLRLLQGLGVHYFQGFHFSCPLSPAELRVSPLLQRARLGGSTTVSPPGAS